MIAPPRDARPRCFVLFASIHDVMAAEERLLARGAPVRLVQTPRELSADCGAVLEFDCDRFEAIRAFLAAAGVKYEALRRLEAGTSQAS